MFDYFKENVAASSFLAKNIDDGPCKFLLYGSIDPQTIIYKSLFILFYIFMKNYSQQNKSYT